MVVWGVENWNGRSLRIILSESEESSETYQMVVFCYKQLSKLTKKRNMHIVVMDNKHSFLYLIKQFVKLSRISWKLVRFFSQVCNIVTVLILEAAIITTKIARSSLWFGVTWTILATQTRIYVHKPSSLDFSNPRAAWLGKGGIINKTWRI